METERRSCAVQTLWQRYHGLRMVAGKRAFWFDNAAYLAGEPLPEEIPPGASGILVAE
jgi:hypothetical protein